ncbi:t-SNARE [Terfezia boudieri ATCC MYA-4762]|uniref:t-SNARE n=1 Tax=Terfezia boudieri ATCC MYA-4762 TaxID=1051890 RepID=A0A3N4LNM9_9PEZI|nr:t-SNARE [Terfezia boudieri ATCC MYA-4762]
MWRDRTNLYISYRQSYSHHPAKRPRFSGSNRFDNSVSEDRRGLLSSDQDDDNSGDAVIEMDLLPPSWADVSDEVNEILALIKKKSVKLDQLHQKHVLPGFDDKTAEEGEIEQLTTEITTMFHQCGNAIKKVERLAKQGGITSQSEEAMSRNIRISLAAKVQEASTAFRKKQSAYLKKLRSLQGAAGSIERANSPSVPSFLQDEEADVSYSQSTLQQQSATLTSNDAAINQREREITDIAKGIIELADIFKELQTMVIDQGTMLDRIDYNIENMAVHVKAAEKELVQENYTTLNLNHFWRDNTSHHQTSKP